MFGDQAPVSPLRGPKDSLVLGATVVATTSLSCTRVLVLGPATAPLQEKNSDVLWDAAEVVPEDESGRSRPSGLSEPPEGLCFWTWVGREGCCQDLPLPPPPPSCPALPSQHPGTFCKQDEHLQSSRACVYVTLLIAQIVFFPFPALIRQKKKSEGKGLQVVCFKILKVSLYALVFPWSIAGCPLAEQSQLSELWVGGILQRLFCFS